MEVIGYNSSVQRQTAEGQTDKVTAAPGHDAARNARYAQPSYRVVHETLLEMIDAQSREGDSLPSENELAARFSVSRNTIRRALELLLHEGRIVRIPGKGTFVAGRARTFELSGIEGMNKSITEQGGPASAFNRVDKMEVVPAPLSVAGRLDIPAGEPVVHLLRLRLSEKYPLSLDETFIVADIGERLRSVDLEHQDLFTVLEQRFSYPLEEVNLRVSAGAADSRMAAALQVPANCPVLQLDRVGWSQGRKILCENIAFRADRFVFSATARRGPE